MADFKTKWEARVEGKKVVMISKSYCPFCSKAKNVFDKYLKNGTLSTDDYDVEEIENSPDCGKIQDVMAQITGGRSVPRVFINGKFVGGGDDIVRLEGSGELAKLLK